MTSRDALAVWVLLVYVPFARREMNYSSVNDTYSFERVVEYTHINRRSDFLFVDIDLRDRRTSE